MDSIVKKQTKGQMKRGRLVQASGSSFEKPTTDKICQHCLCLAFCEFCLPKRIQAGYRSNFHESRLKSPFPIPLYLWLLGLGIELVCVRTYCRTDQTKVERTYQLSIIKFNKVLTLYPGLVLKGW